MRKAKKAHNSKYKNTIKKVQNKEKNTKNLAIFGCISGEKLRKNGLTYPSLTLTYPSLTLTYPSLTLTYPSLTLTYPSLTLTYQDRGASPPGPPS